MLLVFSFGSDFTESFGLMWCRRPSAQSCGVRWLSCMIFRGGSVVILEIDPQGVAAQLLMPLFNAMSQGGINPFPVKSSP